MARTRRSTSKKSSSPPLKAWQLLLVVLIACGVYAYQEGLLDRWLGKLRGETVTPVPSASGGGNPLNVELPRAAVETGSWYQAYFTRPDYPEKAVNRNGGVDEAMIVDIDAAKTSVRIASFDFDMQSLTSALIRAKKRGVTVEVVSDDENLTDANVADVAGQLEKAKIPITWDSRPAFMHNKIMVVDDTILWTGSMNFAYTDVYRNNNNMIRTTVEPLVANYRQRLTDLVAGRMGSKAEDNVPNHEITLDNGVKIENYFSPSDGARAKLLGYLKNAKQSVKMLAFSYTDDSTGKQLIALHKAGVDVEIVMEARNADGTGSEFAAMEKAGIPILRDGNCYVAHNKVIVIDDRVVVTGSYNFTAAAEDSNDENLLIITDPSLAALYGAEFDRLQGQAENPTRCGS